MMTVQELINELQGYDPQANVLVYIARNARNAVEGHVSMVDQDDSTKGMNVPVLWIEK